MEIAANSILYVDGVTVSFDGFRALNSLSLTLEPNELRAVIGPNGAGKTTLMDVITGKTRPDEGTVLFQGSTDLLSMDEAAIARIGIGRKFQRPTVFENQSVRDNVAIALKEKRGVFASLFFEEAERHREQIDEILETVSLSREAARRAGELSHGQKQWLEIGMLLAQDPELLLVDEPAAGMTNREREVTVELLRHISEQHSVIVVEHDMEFVRTLECRVTVLHEGAVLAEGALDQVQANERVIQVYLGR